MQTPSQSLSSQNPRNLPNPLIKDQWNTPNKMPDTKPDTTSKKNHSPKRTHHKKKASYEPQASPNTSLEARIRQKVDDFGIISRTLKEYFRLSRHSRNSNSESIDLTIKMIKAFGKTEIQGISPSMNLMIDSMLEALPVPKNRNKKSEKNKKYEKISQTHSRQFSFSEKNRHLKREQSLRKQIQQLESNLHELKEESHVMVEICEQFEEMEKDQKLKYIKDLQQILEEQAKILQKMSNPRE